MTPRKPLVAGTYRWASSSAASIEEAIRDAKPPERGELDALLLLHMANLAEQARADDGSPGVWLAELREVAELLIESDAVALPLFVAGLAQISVADERSARRAYRAALAATGSAERVESGFGLAAAMCPVLPEPCLWEAYRARRVANVEAAGEWARCARRRLVALGTAWDKRLTYDEWLRLTRVLEQPDNFSSELPARAVDDPRQLFDALTEAVAGRPPALARPTGPSRPDAAAGTRRFLRYVDSLGDGDGAAFRGVYPDLESRAWYDPSAFPVARYLEAHFEEVREELLSLDPAQFRPESERISRAGDWDVVFLYERGRRHDDVCAACPITTRGIEGDGAMRTAAGLIYVSRMRAHTHIRAHRGPTNLRLRCHLGLKVPNGDCAIRVGDERRGWVEGRCLVFDDHFEHEAWNHTEEDRTVLIVDLWHPALSKSEIELLAGLHRYAYAYGRQLSRYWAANAAAVRAASS